MAIKISGTTVIGDSRSLENVGIGSTTITTLFSGITTTATNKTLVNREFCEVVAEGLTISLPTNPDPGNVVKIGVGTFTDTVVGRNGSNIMSLSEDLTIDTQNINLGLIYVDNTIGWRIF